MARIITVALSVGSAQFNMVEICSLPLQAMLTTPAPGTQWVYVAIKQPVVCYSQISFKCSVTETSERVRTIHASIMNQEANS